MPDEKYLVSTTMGDTLIDTNSDMYVHLAKRGLIKKKPYDVNPGERVLFGKPFASTTLEDVEPVLHKSPRYEYSQAVMHEKNSEGAYIPKFRAYLIRGLSQTGVISLGNLEKKILKEDGHDFTAEEYETMGKAVLGLIEERGYERSGLAVENWLRGYTLAPSDWGILRALKCINPDFEDFRQYDESETSMYFNYRLYVTVRQGAMRYLNNCRGTPGQDQDNEEPGQKRISLTPIYQIIFDHFMKDLGLSYAAARVNSIRKLKNPRQIDHEKHTNPHLCNGVIQRLPEGLGFFLKDYLEAWNQKYVLGSYFKTAINGYGPLDSEVEWDSSSRKLLEKTPEIPKIFMMNELMPEIFKYFGESLDPQLDSRKCKLTEEEFSPFSGALDMHLASKDFVKKVMDALLEGKMDSYFKFDRGTMLQLIEAVVRTRRCIPNMVFDYLVSVDSYYNLRSTKSYIDSLSHDEKTILSRERINGNRRERRRIAREHNLKLRDQIRAKKTEVDNRSMVIEQRYGLVFPYARRDSSPYEDPTGSKVFLTDVVFSAIPKDFYSNTEVSSSTVIGEYLQSISNDKEEIRRVISAVPDHLKLCTRQETDRILDEFGLKQIINLRWQDFLFDKVQTSIKR
ncbi:MAG: hypothetical protein HZB67_04310 [Candidatus Aenigmarchaeota archaeon]|nr:hypothetical protein [Candidatus Aenigmarchaeota archaeon]